MANDKSLQSAARETGSSSLPSSAQVPAEWGSVRLPGGVDYAALRAAIGIGAVLKLLQWRAAAGKGTQLRGPCPVHRSKNVLSTNFSVNLNKNAFQCFGCGKKGNQLDLFAAATGLPLRAAALELCRRLCIEPP